MIGQVRFSNSVKFFEEGFCERWGVTTYRDLTAPCFFAGVYNMNDVKVINNHKGFKLIWNPGRVREIFNHISPQNVIVMEGWVDCSSINKRFKVKQSCIEIKDFSMFTPNPLGNKIYCYLGNSRLKEVMGYSFIESIRKKVLFEVIYGYQGHNIQYVKERYYDNCFVNIKPSITGGFTTAQELAFMGRKTLSNAFAPFCTSYKSITEVIEFIQEESKKIGTIQPSCMGDFINMDEEWKQLNTWIR
jgi:hypothetical protein